MAASCKTDDGSDHNGAVLYIMPQRIQKKMFQDIRNGTDRIHLRVRERYGEDVSHIVTQYTDRDQVLRQLQRDGVAVGDSSHLGKVICVTLAWLSACLKAGTEVRVEDEHLVKEAPKTEKMAHQDKEQIQGRAQQPVKLWACQRVTPLKHFNHRFTDALEILEKNANFQNTDNDHSRALAFRRASCVLKSLPFKVERLSQVKGLKDIGGHALKVIQSLLEDGYCEEVQQVSNEWFRLMKEFTGVFGVGVSTAKKWIDEGWKSVDDVRNRTDISKDKRLIWGLAFHEDLSSPVTAAEADTFVDIVKTELERIRPGAITCLTGGFRRGKPSGHDVDILLTHEKAGEEKGLLGALLEALTRRGLILWGRHEPSTYSHDCLASDSKLSALRGQLDHFEKWMGICKFHKTPSSSSLRPGAFPDADSAGDVKEEEETEKKIRDGSGEANLADVATDQDKAMGIGEFDGTTSTGLDPGAFPDADSAGNVKEEEETEKIRDGSGEANLADVATHQDKAMGIGKFNGTTPTGLDPGLFLKSAAAAKKENVSEDILGGTVEANIHTYFQGSSRGDSGTAYQGVVSGHFERTAERVSDSHAPDAGASKPKETTLQAQNVLKGTETTAASFPLCQPHSDDQGELTHCQVTDSQTTTGGHTERNGEKHSERHTERHTERHREMTRGSEQPWLKRQKTGTAAATLTPRELAESARSWRARRVDLIVAPYSQYHYAVVGWTGSKQFNRDVRTYAQRQLGAKLTSHGLWDHTQRRAVPAESEEEVFHNLKLQYQRPEDRNC